MRLVIDTNCLLVCIPRSSSSRWLFDAITSGAAEVGITTEIVEEYEEVISDFYSPMVAYNVVEMLLNLETSVMTNIYFKWNLIKRDHDDNKFVDCSIACQADYIVTHDKHFNELKK